MDRLDERLLSREVPRSNTSTIHVSLTTNQRELSEAQALRWRVFSDEMGARLPSKTFGIDEDIFDPHCDHLIARDTQTDQVVGTYRLLSPQNARRIGCYYADAEFDLTRLQLLREGLLELGRACVHPEYRSGKVISQLWQAILEYARNRNIRYLAGCASMSMLDGGHGAASAYAQLPDVFRAPIEYGVFPRTPLPIDQLDQSRAAQIPALIKAYLRSGAWIGGAPAWDPEFNTADFFIFLPMSRLTLRYAKHHGVAS